MKKLFPFLLLVMVHCAQAQTDSTERGMALVSGLGCGPGFIMTQPTLPRAYDQLLLETNAYCGVKAEIGVLWKEQIGFRIIAARVGRKSTPFGMEDYANTNYTGYHYVIGYGDAVGGYDYNYITPQFVYRIGSEPFNLSLSGGAGIGWLQTPDATLELQHNGDNDFMEVKYTAENPWNMNAEAGADFAYMRQITPHWFANVGVYVNCNATFVNFDYTYSEQRYAQPVSVNENYTVKQTMIQINTGIFLNYQWNQRESARSFYY